MCSSTLDTTGMEQKMTYTSKHWAIPPHLWANVFGLPRGTIQQQYALDSVDVYELSSEQLRDVAGLKQTKGIGCRSERMYHSSQHNNWRFKL